MVRYAKTPSSRSNVRASRRPESRAAIASGSGPAASEITTTAASCSGPSAAYQGGFRYPQVNRSGDSAARRRASAGGSSYR